MIQRIQTVFLFLIAIAMICVLFLPIWSKTDTNGQEYVLNAFSLAATTAATTSGTTAASVSKATVAIAVLSILAALVALYEIFQYKNRLTQMKLGFLNTLLLAAVMGSCFYYVNYVGEEMLKSETRGEYEAGFYLPLLALALNALANRFIRRDEQLVRSVDRLR